MEAAGAGGVAAAAPGFAGRKGEAGCVPVAAGSGAFFAHAASGAKANTVKSQAERDPITRSAVMSWKTGF
jgi:hypothetical protein